MSEQNITLVPVPPAGNDSEQALKELSVEEIASSLDAESHRIVRSVLYRDTADAREGVARAFVAEARTNHTRLKQSQRMVGTWEQMQAIERTGACPDARFWLLAAWCLVLIDAVFWFIASAQAFAF
jgi:hypothetical protein